MRLSDIVGKVNMANENLKKAKKSKNDEFYTQYSDIQKEINAYLDYNPEVFKDKTILLPCDDPEWSNFTKFFAQNFERFGLKKLISTSYAIESKNLQSYCQLSLLEQNSSRFDENKTKIKGKIFTLEKDITGDGKINIEDLEWDYLEGDGDFRSKEVTKLRNEADIIITNPPFSLFREFLEWLFETNKQFVIIGNKNCITYKETFSKIKNNKMWVGKTPMGIDMLFRVPDEDELKRTKKIGSGYRLINGVAFARSQSIWYTNIEHGKRHQPLQLMSMQDNIKFSSHKSIRENEYPKYDNYDAIEVPFTDAIPSDYDGVMGVPITFLDKYCPEQFEIVALGNLNGFNPNKHYVNPISHIKGKESKNEMINSVLTLRGEDKKGNYYTADNIDYHIFAPYARILIKRKVSNEN